MITKPKARPPETDDEELEDEDEMEYDDEAPLFDPDEAGR